jgi:rRNA-processing protein EBP2
MGKKSKQNKKSLQKELEKIKNKHFNPNLKKEDEEDEDDEDESQRSQQNEENSDFEAIYEEEIEESKAKSSQNEENKKEVLLLKEKFKSKFDSKFKSNEIWIERLTVNQLNEMERFDVDDDIKRELVFYNLSHKGAVDGILKLKSMSQRINRPDDYMAEMLKSEEQVSKIKRNIIDNENRIKKFQLREEKMLNKKFNKKGKGKLSKDSIEYNKTSNQAIDHWKKSIKEDPNEYYKLDEYLNKNVRTNRKMSRKSRDLKFNPKLAHKEKVKNVSRKSGFNKEARRPKEKTRRPGKNFRVQKRGGKK